MSFFDLFTLKKNCVHAKENAKYSKCRVGYMEERQTKALERESN